MRHYLIMALAVIIGTAATAQQNGGKIDLNKTTFLLPNGKKFNMAKFDSLENAWGKGRISFVHNAEDDKKGIMHLRRNTDAQIEKSRNNQKATASMLGKRAPEFELTDLKGKKWSLKELRGKVVVLNFWHTACAPCLQEMPELNKIVDEHKKGDVVFLALTYNTREQAKAFTTRKEFKYAILPDSNKANSDYKATTFPTSMVIDRNGIIRFVQQDPQDIAATLRKAIKAAQ